MDNTLMAPGKQRNESGTAIAKSIIENDQSHKIH